MIADVEKRREIVEIDKDDRDREGEGGRMFM